MIRVAYVRESHIYSFEHKNKKGGRGQNLYLTCEVAICSSIALLFTRYCFVHDCV